MPSFVFEAIGTRWQIDIHDVLDSVQEADFLTTIRARIDVFDVTYSRFRDDSWVTMIAQAAGTYPLPADAQPLFALYEEMYRRTHGAMTPLIGQVLVDAGYDAAYSLHAGSLTSPRSWDDVIALTNKTITLHEPALLDFGAAGKGYCIDLIGSLLEEQGIHDYVIDAGGDIRCRGTRPLRIGLENPMDAKQIVGVTRIQQQSICGSAGNRRAWGSFHHIIDPFSLASPRHIFATWVIADTTLLADALATALWFVPASSLVEHYPFSSVILYADGRCEVSSNFPGELFTS
ncbi:MAG: FAD:protein FMN transferase [Patescibacteria group bacterium]